MLDTPTLDQVQDALEFIDADCSREDWVKVLMGIKHEFGDAGYDIADMWSQSGSSYNPDSFKTTWKSIKASGGTTIATVFKFATENGYKLTKQKLSQEDRKKLDAEKAKRAKERAAREEQEEAERTFWHNEIARISSLLLSHFTTKCKNNAYLYRKQVKSFGCHRFNQSVVVIFRENFNVDLLTDGPAIKAFFDQLPKNKDELDYSFLHIKRNYLVVPLIDIDKKVWNLQIITDKGTKLFLKHGRKQGCFHFLGKAKSCNIIAIAEGYATAASIYMAMNWPCAVAFDNGNLPVVANTLRQKFPEHTFIICGDNDYNTKDNPGATSAKKAAAAVGGLVAIPNFKDEAEAEA